MPRALAKKSGKKSGPGKDTRFTADDPRRGRGPKPGAPNAGRPPEKIREACRLAFDERIKVLTEIADAEHEPAQVRIKAIEALAKYGLGTTITPTDTDGKTLGTGVLAVPLPVGADQWSAVAASQQAALMARPDTAKPASGE